MVAKKRKIKQVESSPAINKAWDRHRKREKVKALGRGKKPKKVIHRKLMKSIYG